MEDNKNMEGSKSYGSRNSTSQKLAESRIERINANWETSDFMSEFPPRLKPQSLGITAIQALYSISMKIDRAQAMRRFERVCINERGEPVPVSHMYIKMVNDRLIEKDEERQRRSSGLKTSRASSRTSEPENGTQTRSSKDRESSTTGHRDSRITLTDREVSSTSPLHNRKAVQFSRSTRSSLSQPPLGPSDSHPSVAPRAPMSDAGQPVGHTAGPIPSTFSNEKLKDTIKSSSLHPKLPPTLDHAKDKSSKDEPGVSSLAPNSSSFQAMRANAKKRSFAQRAESPSSDEFDLPTKRARLNRSKDLTKERAKKPTKVNTVPGETPISKSRESSYKPSTITEPKSGNDISKKPSKKAELNSEEFLTTTKKIELAPKKDATLASDKRSTSKQDGLLDKSSINTTIEPASQVTTSLDDGAKSGQGVNKGASILSQASSTTSSPASLDINSQISLFGEVLEPPKHSGFKRLEIEDRSAELLALRQKNDKGLEELMKLDLSSIGKAKYLEGDSIVVNHPIGRQRSEISEQSTSINQQSNPSTAPKGAIRTRKTADPFLHPKRDKPRPKLDRASRPSTTIYPIRDELVPKKISDESQVSTPASKSNQRNDRGPTRSLKTTNQQSKAPASSADNLEQYAYSAMKKVASILSADQIKTYTSGDDAEKAGKLEKVFSRTCSRLGVQIDGIFHSGNSTTAEASKTGNLPGHGSG